jgi:hypothetical protein
MQDTEVTTNKSNNRKYSRKSKDNQKYKMMTNETYLEQKSQRNQSIERNNEIKQIFSIHDMNEMQTKFQQYLQMNVDHICNRNLIVIMNQCARHNLTLTNHVSMTTINNIMKRNSPFTIQSKTIANLFFGLKSIPFESNSNDSDNNLLPIVSKASIEENEEFLSAIIDFITQANPKLTFKFYEISLCFNGFQGFQPSRKTKVLMKILNDKFDKIKIDNTIEGKDVAAILQGDQIMVVVWIVQ